MRQDKVPARLNTVAEYIAVADKDMHKALILAVSDVMILRGILKRAHGVLENAHDVPVPANIEDDIAPALAVLLEQRNEAREGLSMG